MNICLFESDEITRALPITDPRARHILKVLHKREGDEFAAGIIEGDAGRARITRIDDGEIAFEFTAEGESAQLFPLTMVIGFPRPIQLRRILRDMTCLGTGKVRLVGTELGEKSYLASDLCRADAIRALLIDGAEQAGSTHMPRVTIHKTLAEYLHGAFAEDAVGTALFAADNAAGARGLRAALESASPREAVCAVGSERGWSPRERAALRETGFAAVSLGQRILRTETACTVSAALILSAMGALDT